MAYNKPLGLYTSVEQTAYWKKGNAGQNIVSRLMLLIRVPRPTHMPAALWSLQLKSSKNSVCALCNWVALRPGLSGLKDALLESVGWPWNRLLPEGRRIYSWRLGNNEGFIYFLGKEKNVDFKRMLWDDHFPCLFTKPNTEGSTLMLYIVLTWNLSVTQPQLRSCS